MAQTLTYVKHSRLVDGEDFGPVWGASGVQGFFGEGYLIHWLFKILTLFIFFSFRRVTFVAKTTTWKSNEGFMPMKDDRITPKEIIPKCVKANIITQAVINSVGLSGPGAEFLFKTRRWQKRKKPFMISFMSVAKTADERLHELSLFRDKLSKVLRASPHLILILGLQWNVSCPNVGQVSSELPLDVEVERGLEILSSLGIKVVVKFNALVQVEVLVRLDQNKYCHGFCLGNTIPWVALPDAIRAQYFGVLNSPLADLTSPPNLNAGGLSGTDYNRTLSCQLIRDARKAGVVKHINGCGGIRHWRHVDEYYWAGASSISVGSGLSPLAFWRMRSVISRAFKLWSNDPAVF